jgi:hypothetical protein
MGALSSLSKSATLACWWISVISTFGFGTLFLVSWLSEEFAQSEKWKKRRKLLIALAIVGVAGEQIGTIAEFALSQHLQTIEENRIAHLAEIGPRDLSPEEQERLIGIWSRYAGGSIKLMEHDDPESAAFSTLLFRMLRKAKMDVQQMPWQLGERFIEIFILSGDPSDLGEMGTLDCSLKRGGIMSSVMPLWDAKGKCDLMPSSRCTLRIVVGADPKLFTQDQIRKQPCWVTP